MAPPPARRKTARFFAYSAEIDRPAVRERRAEATRASGRGEVDDARQQLAVFAVSAAVEIRVAIRGEGLIDRGPVLGAQETLRRRQDDAFLAPQVLPQEGCVAGH